MTGAGHISTRSGRRRWALVWTWDESKDVPTKKEGELLARAWKARYEDKGWRVVSTSGCFSGYKAYAPDYDASEYSDFGPGSKVHVCLVVELNEQGKAIWPTWKPKPERKPVEKKPQRRVGRKPVGA